MQVSEAIESRLIELAMMSPTAFNLQHWRFVVVRNPERRRQIREVTGDQVTNASVPMPLRTPRCPEARCRTRLAGPTR